MSYRLAVGQILDERFKITDQLVEGGMATVFKALDEKDSATVAIKVPLLRYESDPAFYSRFLREEEIALKLNHPYVLRIVDVPLKSRPYIVMEYLDGETLGQRMRRAPKLDITEGVAIAAKICDALTYLHANGVVHRDLKPDNVMLCKDGSIRILDFGLAMGSTRKITVTGLTSSMGTPDYMSPEQVLGKKGDARTDIYSLGVFLYQLATGSAPYVGDDFIYIMNAKLAADPFAPRVINPDISEPIEEIILHAMARKPAERYASAAEMKAELDAPEKVVVTGRAKRLVTATPAQIRWIARKPYVIAALIPVILILMAYVWCRLH